jgi:hypothetical protein
MRSTCSRGLLLPARAVRPDLGRARQARTGQRTVTSTAPGAVGVGTARLTGRPSSVQPWPHSAVRRVLPRLDQLATRRNSEPAANGPARPYRAAPLHRGLQGARYGVRRSGVALPGGVSGAGLAGRLDGGDRLPAITRHVVAARFSGTVQRWLKGVRQRLDPRTGLLPCRPLPSQSARLRSTATARWPPRWPTSARWPACRSTPRGPSGTPSACSPSATRFWPGRRLPGRG